MDYTQQGYVILRRKLIWVRRYACLRDGILSYKNFKEDQLPKRVINLKHGSLITIHQKFNGEHFLIIRTREVPHLRIQFSDDREFKAWVNSIVLQVKRRETEQLREAAAARQLDLLQNKEEDDDSEELMESQQLFNRLSVRIEQDLNERDEVNSPADILFDSRYMSATSFQTSYSRQQSPLSSKPLSLAPLLQAPMSPALAPRIHPSKKLVKQHSKLPSRQGSSSSLISFTQGVQVDMVSSWSHVLARQQFISQAYTFLVKRITNFKLARAKAVPAVEPEVKALPTPIISLKARTNQEIGDVVKELQACLWFVHFPKEKQVQKLGVNLFEIKDRRNQGSLLLLCENSPQGQFYACLSKQLNSTAAVWAVDPEEGGVSVSVIVHDSSVLDVASMKRWFASLESNQQILKI